MSSDLISWSRISLESGGGYLMIWFFDFFITDFTSNLKAVLPKFTDKEAPSPLIPTAGKRGSSELFSKVLSR